MSERVHERGGSGTAEEARAYAWGLGPGARSRAQGDHLGPVLDLPGTRPGAFAGQVLDMFRNVLNLR